jgi:hypothetical protein
MIDCLSEELRKELERELDNMAKPSYIITSPEEYKEAVDKWHLMIHCWDNPFFRVNEGLERRCKQ